jgi:hypothetical protein
MTTMEVSGHNECQVLALFRSIREYPPSVPQQFDNSVTAMATDIHLKCTEGDTFT